eukprot:2447034-Pyramimonas_sp.AAC.1
MTGGGGGGGGGGGETFCMSKLGCHHALAPGVARCGSSTADCTRNSMATHPTEKLQNKIYVVQSTWCNQCGASTTSETQPTWGNLCGVSYVV